MTVYLDCNATTPMEPLVRDAVLKYMAKEFGNAGSRTHEFGTRAKQAVQKARDKIAEMVAAKREEVIFTSGATESNNLAILGLKEYGEQNHKRHIVSTQIEHKAVLEPLVALEKVGFEVTLVPPTKEGWVEPEAIKEAVREDTLLVSVMQVNNETGIIQPIAKMTELLAEHPAYFHTDAAQGFGKDITTLRNPRIDMISVSAHKIYGPKGVGALIMRRRDYQKVPLTPLMYGGGQERGLRPGTLPVHLIVGFGVATELALKNFQERANICRAFRDQALEALAPLKPIIHGDLDHTLSHVINFSIAGLDSEAAILALKKMIAISNGSACTSSSYTPSHVLKAMNLSDTEIQGALRISWCHLTESVDWTEIVKRLKEVLF
ncbi:cysteine desulfurase DndA [Candidatus Parabeggiatoa sp. HSG14]|uniref:cysteine desulfurase DndA n=1 Tax=Candidatus Parabeggiatoa sp. HSG14 TaxID=3055593 RepID=UPI0025A84E6A|nr:cysteine desulfurase DndA [Thiotrichales bacterium HSG14]